MNYSEYKKTIYLALVGKSIGGILGARTENQKQWNDFGKLEDMWPKELPPNDDLDIQILWLEALQEYGPALNGENMTAIWQDRCFYFFCEYGSFLYNAQRRIMPPLSGKWDNYYFSESNGCPIRAEIWGLVSPFRPDIAAQYAKLDASLDHDIDGASSHIEQFWAAVLALVFTKQDLYVILDKASAWLPEGSKAQKAYQDMKLWADEKGLSDKALWRRLIRHYGSADASKALTNFAITLYAIFRSGRDLKKAMSLCIYAGWDVDCTAATAAAVMCALYGESIVPKSWLKKMGSNLLCAVEVRHKKAPILDTAADIARCGIEVSLFHDESFKMAGMPKLQVRRPEKKQITLAVEYTADPVLFRNEPAKVKLTVSNDGPECTDSFKVAAPAWCKVSPAKGKLTVPAGGKTELLLEISVKDPEAGLPDKNIFDFVFHGESVKFGLAGSRTWKAYGPYWDMWDNERFPVCPYHNDKVDCVPGAVGMMGDHYQHYAFLNHKYLDEKALNSGKNLPDEAPFILETGSDLICNESFGGFTGAACYYLVRDFELAETLNEKDLRLAIGRNGPLRIWIDGKQIYEINNSVAWAQHNDEGQLPCKTIKAGKHRMVVKLIRPGDEMKFSFSFLKLPYGTQPLVKGISWFVDSITDLK